MVTPDGNDATEPAIRKRLVALADKFTQAEMARRTGVNPANVHRYLRSNRIPAAFVAACAEGFNVNLDWLMRGGGPQFTTDKVEDGGEMTEGLLEVVQALNVVEHVRLGALARKKHLLMLRELRDAMARYDDLHKRLNKQSVPILRTVLRDLRDAMDKRKLDLADELARTADQLGRFCDDPELSQERVVLQAHLDLLSGDLHAALEHVQNSIVFTLYRGGKFGEREFEAAVEAVSTLAAWTQFPEARRIGKAALALADETVLKSQPALKLRVQMARMQFETGDLREGIQTLMDVRGRLSGEYAATADAFLAKALLFTGAVDVAGAVTFGEDSRIKAVLTLGFALFTEDLQDLERAVAYWEAMHKGDVKAKESQLRWAADLLLRVLRGEKKGLAKEVRRFEERPPGLLGPFAHGPIIGCRLFYLMGRATDARRCLRDSARMIKAIPYQRSVIVLPQARHMRSVLELGTAKEQKEAVRFFKRHLRRGYLCFEGILDE